MVNSNFGIIGLLAVGVGAFALYKNKDVIENLIKGGNKEQNVPPQLSYESCQGYRSRLYNLGYRIDWISDCQPVTITAPTAIIPTDSPVTSGTGQTGVFSGVGTVTLPTQIQTTTPSVSTPVADEEVDEIIDTIFDGQLDPSSQDAIVEQATKIVISDITLYGFTGQFDINETIKMFGNTNTKVGVLTYDWDFGDGAISSGTNKQYTNHSYEKAGQYTIRLTVSSSYGASATKTKTINVIPDPIQQGDVTAKVLDQANSAIIRLTSTHSQGMKGSYTVNMTGVNVKRVSGNTYINSKSQTDIQITGLTSGYTMFSVDFRPEGSSKDIIIHDNETVFIYDEPVVAPPPQSSGNNTPTCSPSTTVQSILFQLDTVLTAPSWYYSGNVKDVKECRIDEQAFINSYNYLLSTGVITIR